MEYEGLCQGCLRVRMVEVSNVVVICAYVASARVILVG